MIERKDKLAKELVRNLEITDIEAQIIASASLDILANSSEIESNRKINKMTYSEKDSNTINHSRNGQLNENIPLIINAFSSLALIGIGTVLGGVSLIFAGVGTMLAFKTFFSSKEREMLDKNIWLSNRNDTMQNTHWSTSNSPTEQHIQFHSSFNGAGIVNGDFHYYYTEQNHTEKNQSIVESAIGIKQIIDDLNELSPDGIEKNQDYLTATAVAKIQRNPQLKQRVLGALKAGQKDTLEQLISHPMLDSILMAVEGLRDQDIQRQDDSLS